MATLRDNLAACVPGFALRGLQTRLLAAKYFPSSPTEHRLDKRLLIGAASIKDFRVRVKISLGESGK